MNRCLNERALLQIHLHEGPAADAQHLRACRDCAARYEALGAELGTIRHVLADDPPPGLVPGRARPVHGRWLALATASAALALLIFHTAVGRSPMPNPAGARAASVSAFSDDLSAALFEAADTERMPQLAFESPAEAALEAGEPCTADRFFSGECTDQLSAFAGEDD